MYRKIRSLVIIPRVKVSIVKMKKLTRWSTFTANIFGGLHVSKETIEKWNLSATLCLEPWNNGVCRVAEFIRIKPNRKYYSSILEKAEEERDGSESEEEGEGRVDDTGIR